MGLNIGSERQFKGMVIAAIVNMGTRLTVLATSLLSKPESFEDLSLDEGQIYTPDIKKFLLLKEEKTDQDCFDLTKQLVNLDKELDKLVKQLRKYREEEGEQNRRNNKNNLSTNSKPNAVENNLFSTNSKPNAVEWVQTLLLGIGGGLIVIITGLLSLPESVPEDLSGSIEESELGTFYSNLIEECFVLVEKIEKKDKNHARLYKFRYFRDKLFELETQVLKNLEEDAQDCRLLGPYSKNNLKKIEKLIRRMLEEDEEELEGYFLFKLLELQDRVKETLEEDAQNRRLLGPYSKNNLKKILQIIHRIEEEEEQDELEEELEN